MKKIFFCLRPLLFLFFAIPSIGQVGLDNGLVAYYPLNGNGVDAGPNSYNTSSSDPPDPTTDHINNSGMAMSFNGTSDNFYTANDVFTGMDNFTISVWFNTSVLASQIMVGKHSGSTSGEWYFGMVNDGNIRFMHLNTGGNRVDLNVAYPYNDGQWHHGVAVYNGSKMEIFIDGVSIASQARSGSTKKHDDVNLHLGGYAGTGWQFNGKLDEIHIYRRALNASEIAALARNTTVTVGNISPATYCAGDVVSIPYNVSGDGLEPGNVFTAYLSDQSGNFANKKIIGTATGASSGTIQAEIDKKTNSGSGFRVMVVSSNQSLASLGDNGVNLTVNNAVNGIVDLSGNLFGYFPFNGNTGDSSGIGRNLSINGSINTTADRHGKADKAYDFEGGYLNWGKIGEINNGGSALSIALWLKPESFSTHFIPIANNWNATWGGVYMGINDNSNGIRWRVSSNNYICIGPDLTLNEWVHVVGVFGSGRLKLYYNGTEVASANCPSNITGVDMNFMLGRESSGTSSVHYKGGMDDVRFFKRELSGDEVKSIYHNGLAFSNSGLCTGEMLKLSTITVPGATYSWTGPDGFSSADQNPSISNVSSVNAGTYTLTIANNGCMYQSSSEVIVNSELEPVEASNDGSLCDGETLTLSCTAITGATYSWAGPNSFTSADQNPVLTAATTAATGTYTVTVTKGLCSKQAETNAIIHPIPAAPTAGSNSPVCQGNTLNLTAGTVTGATYSWTGPDGFTSSGQNPSRNNMDTDDAGSYFVKAIVNGCESPAADVMVTVNTVGVVSADNNGPYCEGDDVNLDVTVISGATYSWSGPDGFSSAAQNPMIADAHTGASGNYVVTVTKNGCSRQASTNITVSTAPVAVAGSNGPVCAGAALDLTANTVSGASYSWSGPNGFSSNDKDPSIAAVTTLATGTYTVTIAIGGCSDQDDITVAVNPAPSVPTAGNNGPVCEGEDLDLTALDLAGASYSWSGPNGFVSNVRNPAIPVATAAASGMYTVTAKIGDCTRQSTTNVTVSAPPVANAGGDFSVCEGTTLNLSANTFAGASYSWSGPNNFTSADEDPSIPSATLSAAGTYTVIIISGSCTGQDNVVVTIDPAPVAPVAGSNSPVCIGDNINLTASAVPGASYSWTGPNGFSSTDQNPTRSSVTASHSGTYTVVATVGICKSVPESVNVTVNSINSVTASNHGPYCAGQTIQLEANTITGASYSWSGPNMFSSTDEDPAISNSTTFAEGVYTVTVSLGSCSAQKTTSVTVNSGPAKPSITLQSFPDRLMSSSFTGNEWSKDGVVLFGQISQSLVFPDPGVYIVTVTGTNGCSTASDPYYFGVTSTSEGKGTGIIAAYPNPSEGIFKISAENVQANELNLTIQNALGFEISKEKYSVSDGSVITDLNLQHLTKGVYYLHFNTGNGQSVLKVVIQ